MFELGKYWAAKGHEVYVLSGRGEKQGPKGVTLIKLPFVTRRFFEFLYSGKETPFSFLPFSFELEGLTMMPFLAPKLIKLRPDIVTCNTLAESFVPIIFGFRLALIGQADISYRYWAFKRASLIHVYDDLSFRNLKKLRFNVVFIPNGVNVPDGNISAKSTVTSKYNIDKDSLILLTIARLVPQKNVNLIIDAVKLIPRKTTLLIIGEGPQVGDLRKQAEEVNPPSKVIFVPPMSHEEVQAFYGICHVYSLPQIEFIGLSLTELEALNHGKPIVTADTPLNRRMVGAFGLVTNVKDPSEYARALVKAASLRLEEEAVREYMRKFDWKDIAEEYLRAFEIVLNRRKSETM
jgi:1,2-diacylglycerol 3-alpha-glucosyltransferase